MATAHNEHPEAGGLPRSKMFEWSTAERVQGVPDDIWPGISTGKGRDDIFVGREAELDHLAQRHSRNPAAVDKSMPPEQTSFITFVTNGPGVGKSALLEELEDRHNRAGGHTLRLRSRDLESHKHLRKALLRSEPAQQANLLRQAKQIKRLLKALEITTDDGTEIARTVFEHVVKAAKRIGKRKPDRHGTESHARMVMLLAQHKEELDAMDLLRIMGDGALGRLMIVVDEAQELGEMDAGETGALLQELGDPGERERLGLRSGGLLLAGLPDAHQRLREMHKSRAYNMHLHPLPEPDVHDLLTKSIRKADPKHTLDHHQVIDLANRLGADFGQWTHHAHAAAFAARGIVRNALRRTPRQSGLNTDELLDWIRTNAAVGTCQLYDQTIELARGIIGISGIHRAAEAMHHGGQVPGPMLHEAMDEQRCRKESNPIETMTNQQGIQALLHVGLIARTRIPGGGTADGLVIPIPSLTNYLLVTEGQAMRQEMLLREKTMRKLRIPMHMEAPPKADES